MSILVILTIVPKKPVRGSIPVIFPTPHSVAENTIGSDGVRLVSLQILVFKGFDKQVEFVIVSTNVQSGNKSDIFYLVIYIYSLVMSQ